MTRVFHPFCLVVALLIPGSGVAQAQSGPPPTVWTGDRAAFQINSEIITSGQFSAVALRAGVGQTSSPKQRAMVLTAMMDFVLLRQDSRSIDVSGAEREIRQRAVDSYAQIRRQYPNEESFEDALKSIGLDQDALREQLEDRELDNERIARHVAKRIDPAQLVSSGNPGKTQGYRLTRLGLRVKRGETTAPQRLMLLLTDSIVDRIPFSEVVRRHSEIPGARKDGGDLGWLPAKDLDPKLRSALAHVPLGGVTAPVRTGDYWCLFQVVDRADLDARGSNAAFDKARENLLQQLRRKARTTVLDPDLKPLVQYLPEGYRLRGQTDSGNRTSK